MKLLVLIIVLFALAQIDERQKQYQDGIAESEKGKYIDANKHLQRAYNIKPDSRIAYWIAYNYAHEDSIQQCLFYLSKSLEINPRVLDSTCLRNIEALRFWAKERDYNTYVKFSLSLSYKPVVKNFPIDTPAISAGPYFLKRVIFQKDTIPPPIIKINKKYRKQNLNEDI